MKTLYKFASWTSWYCPIKKCNTIIYNTDIHARYRIGAHKRKHL